MAKIFEPYLLTFIPIFVTVDAIGNIPIFVSLVEGLSKKQRQRIIMESVTTATALAMIFMLVGKLVLRAVGITISDFQIAGGILLFAIAMRLLLPGTTKYVITNSHDKNPGVFPLGTPLITGPAVLTTTLMMLDSFGVWPTFASLLLNMLICWFVLIRADAFMKVMGLGGTRAFSKIMYILLAAIGVMMVRKGIIGAFLK
ncbi:MAG: MarC family protein [Candidatus Omnitrophica bacterium]|nr:MarC family protein [Candidatus Omnitrophota bacterium]